MTDRLERHADGGEAGTTHRPTGQRGREARVRFQDGTFTLLGHGDHVVCATTGEIIPLPELRYWSVERQEAYASAACFVRTAGRG